MPMPGDVPAELQQIMMEGPFMQAIKEEQQESNEGKVDGLTAALTKEQT